jgi:multiple sugar transport system permease protein
MTDPMRTREQRTGWLLIVPALLVLALVYAYPIARSFWLSLFTQNLGTRLQPIFYGLGNYGRMGADGRFWQTIINTSVFTVSSVVLELILGMAVALVLNQAFRGRGPFPTICTKPIQLMELRPGRTSPGLPSPC